MSLSSHFCIMRFSVTFISTALSRLSALNIHWCINLISHVEQPIKDPFLMGSARKINSYFIMRTADADSICKQAVKGQP